MIINHLLFQVKCLDCIIANVTLFVVLLRYDGMHPVIIRSCRQPDFDALIYGSCYEEDIKATYPQVGSHLGLKIRIDPYNWQAQMDERLMNISEYLFCSIN